MVEVPRGYYLAPLQSLGHAGPSPVRRIVILAIGFVLFWVWFVQSPLVTRADTVQGVSTVGCVTRGTLWTGSAAGVRIVSLTARLALNADPTVFYGQFQLGNGSTSGGSYRSSTTGFATTVVYATWSTVLSAGSAGTLSFVFVVPGYAPTSCASVSEVRVTRSYYDAAQTGAPGGGAFATTGAPTAAPTPPPGGVTVTPVPGAPTQGPGVQCWFVDGVQTCFPKPPDGWCYSIDQSGTGTLVTCTTAPAPTPTPAPDSCAGMGHQFCFVWGPFTVNGNYFIGLLTDWDAGLGENVYVGGWNVVTISSGGGTGFGGTSYTIGGSDGGGSGCSTSGTWTNAALPGTGYNTSRGGNAPQAGLITNLDDSKGSRRTYTTGNLRVGINGNNWGGACSNASNDKSIPVMMSVGSPCGSCTFTVSGVFFADMSGGLGAGSPPPAAPTPTPPPTAGPDYWPGGVPPPIDVNIDANVNICSVNPNISACQTFPPSLNLCMTNPTIQACATPGPSSPPRPGQGGDGSPRGSPVPNGVAACVAASHPPKPGTMPIDPLVTSAPNAGVFDWIGTSVGNIPVIAGNAIKGTANVAVDFVVPGACVGVVITTFADGVKTRVPFSWYAEVETALAVGAGAPISFPVANIGGQPIDLGDGITAAGAATAPYRGILELVPWLLGALVIVRKVMGTVGAGEGGG